MPKGTHLTPNQRDELTTYLKSAFISYDDFKARHRKLAKFVSYSSFQNYKKKLYVRTVPIVQELDLMTAAKMDQAKVTSKDSLLYSVDVDTRNEVLRLSPSRQLDWVGMKMQEEFYRRGAQSIIDVNKEYRATLAVLGLPLPQTP